MTDHASSTTSATTSATTTAITAAGADSAPPPALKVARLLLVDDEPSVLSALRRLFRLQGHEIEQATSGAEGLALLAEKPFDLVISDMRMPEMDGADFLEIVRERHPGIMRMLLTGYADISSTVAAINRGEIHRYIAKPWDDDGLQRLVSEALSLRELQLQNASLQQLTLQQNQALQNLNHELQDLNKTLESRVASRTAELEQINALLEQSYAEIQAQFTMAMTVFSGLLELRQTGVAGHSRRVADLSRRMARTLNMMETAQQDVHHAALLHDIGKISFSDTMLAKPVSAYSAEEQARYQRHPIDGEAALLPLDKLQRAALLVRQHHERFDGRGFPDGLLGPAIAMGARILAVASDFDGLTSGALAERNYTTELAQQTLRDGAGTRYDPQVLAALTEAIKEIAAEAIADAEVEIADLKRGMVLSRDLLSPQGAILLPKGFRFNTEVVKKLQDFMARGNVRLAAQVLCKSIELPKPGAKLATTAPMTATTTATTTAPTTVTTTAGAGPAPARAVS